MNYTPPEDVISPRDCISNIRVVFDGGEESVSIAKINWDGKECLAMRWNVAQREWDDLHKQKGKVCVGMPTSRGYPVWFVLPKGMLDPQSEVGKAFAAAQSNETSIDE